MLSNKYARLDTGADESLLRASTAESLDCEVEESPAPYVITFGNGESVTTSNTTRLGIANTIICPDDQLTDDLVAITPFIDAGYKLLLEQAGGSIYHPDSGVKIPLTRKGTKYLVKLHDIKSVSDITSNDKHCLTASLTESVLQIHERLGHPSV